MGIGSIMILTNDEWINEWMNVCLQTGKEFHSTHTSCVFATLGRSCLWMRMTGVCLYSQSHSPVCIFRPGGELHGYFFPASLHSSASFACTWSLKWRSSAGNKALSSSLHLSFSLPGHEYVAKPSERTPPSEARPERKTGNLFAQCSFLRLSCGARSRAGNAAFTTFPQLLLWLIFKALLAANFICNFKNL